MSKQHFVRQMKYGSVKPMNRFICFTDLMAQNDGYVLSPSD